MADEYRVTVGAPLPRIAQAMPLDGRKVAVEFQDGVVKTVDLAPALESRRIYIPLRNDDKLFRALAPSEYGDAIEWPNGLDFSAEWLERLPRVGMPNAEFRDIMALTGLTLNGMAAALEISRRSVASYRDDKPIPAHIALAARYIKEHFPQAPSGADVSGR